jgi:hypothetical protein
MYLRAPSKQVKYVSDDGSDDDPEFRGSHNNSNSHNSNALSVNQTNTPKRKATSSLSDDGSGPVKKEKNMKAPQLGTVVLFASYDVAHDQGR